VKTNTRGMTPVESFETFVLENHGHDQSSRQYYV
jgi:hypothetical protein